MNVAIELAIEMAIELALSSTVLSVPPPPGQLSVLGSSFAKHFLVWLPVTFIKVSRRHRRPTQLVFPTLENR